MSVSAAPIERPPAPTVIPAKSVAVRVFWTNSERPAVKCTLRENGRMVGRVGPNRYYVIDAAPGVHTYTAKSEATDAVTVQVEPDETTFVKCKIAMGLMVGRPNLSPGTDQDFATVKKAEPMDVAKIAAEIAKDQGKSAAKEASGASD